MRRIWLFIGLAVAIVIAIYGGITHSLYAPSSPSNETTWIKKDMPENHVRFEYPPNFFGEIVPFFRSEAPVQITATSTFEKIIFEKSVFDGSGMNPTKLSQFTQEKLGNETFYFIQTGRFEGQISYSAYVVKNSKVYPFHFAWMVGEDWMNPDYDVTKDANLAIFKKILSSVEIY